MGTSLLPGPFVSPFHIHFVERFLILAAPSEAWKPSYDVIAVVITLVESSLLLIAFKFNFGRKYVDMEKGETASRGKYNHFILIYTHRLSALLACVGRVYVCIYCTLFEDKSPTVSGVSCSEFLSL